MMPQEELSKRFYVYSHDGPELDRDLTAYGLRVLDRAKGLVMNLLNERSLLDDPDSYSAYETIALALHVSVEEIVFLGEKIEARDFWRKHSDEMVKERDSQIRRLEDLCKEHEARWLARGQERETAEAVDKALRQRIGQLESEIGELRASKKKLREALERAREGR